MFFIDSLTGLFNKRAFDIKLKNRIESFTGSFCMMFVDLDHFKQVNDKMGHDAGDNALRESAIFLRGNIRKSDDIFRFGGDEFVVLLYDTKEKDAQLLSCKLEESFVASDIAKRYGISMSIGSGEYFGEGAEQFLKKNR
ncbi:MAG: GGDEF domain-containing protein [Sulfurospirillum sp.]|nr:GGDEF domain-containing protein [Sulfurospirillum sp.]